LVNINLLRYICHPRKQTIRLGSSAGRATDS
jgi:hypothetical protein